MYHTICQKKLALKFPILYLSEKIQWLTICKKVKMSIFGIALSVYPPHPHISHYAKWEKIYYLFNVEQSGEESARPSRCVIQRAGTPNVCSYWRGQNEKKRNPAVPLLNLWCLLKVSLSVQTQRGTAAVRHPPAIPATDVLKKKVLCRVRIGPGMQACFLCYCTTLVPTVH